MVIGSGFIARAYKNLYERNDAVCLYAAGVSNSQCTDSFEFRRDEELLKKTLSKLNNKLIVYISTCSINSIKPLLSSNYVLHKQRMEVLVRGHKNYLILRLPQVVGYSENKYTLLNYFKNNIELGTEFIVLNNSYRNLIDINHVVYISNKIIKNYKNNLIVNIANPESISTTEVLKKLEMVLNKKARCKFIDGRLDNYKIDVAKMLELVDCSACQFDSEYCSRLIRKYYSQI